MSLISTGKMRGRQLFDNLRFKVGIGIVLPLIFVLGVFSYLQYTRHRELEVSLLEQSASNLGQTVEGSLRHAMLEQDFSEVQQIMDDVAERGGCREHLPDEHAERNTLCTAWERDRDKTVRE